MFTRERFKEQLASLVGKRVLGVRTGYEGGREKFAGER